MHLRSNLLLFFALPVAIFAHVEGQSLVRSRQKTAPAAVIKETWTERGKNGIVDRSVTFVITPDITVYLPLKERNTGVGIRPSIVMRRDSSALTSPELVHFRHDVEAVEICTASEHLSRMTFG
jgi:hypothetical protein